MDTMAGKLHRDDGRDQSAGPLLVTPEEAAKSLSICRTKIYELLRSGELRSVQIGSSRPIAVTDLEVYVQQLVDKQQAAVAQSAVDTTVPHRQKGR
jgi:excisionase family DNA binding protein